ncbi:unnamed protein product [Ranitomeya imitator]|uniref:DDE Tnp4 domain-containing protein n=1 Tax=Ranitomeya imitator TaxID=111125 RepID=A0ABN9MG49_9NEOB|nr:unnamed protein product [Ranitomeya imitator]
MLGSIERGQLRIKHKFTNEEYRSLQLLQLKKELVIKPADKGGSIVILDKAYFMEEIYTQLIHIYRYRTFQPFDIEKEIKKLVTHYQQLGTIDKKLGEFLIKKHPVIPVFYTLPKIHKDLQKPPGHPISYLKDTTHFLATLRDLRVLLIGCKLVTIEVNSLYTSIGHQEGLESVITFLSKQTSFSNDQLNFCKDLLTLILTKIFFLFEDKFFLQIKGTAMGC